MDLIVSATFNNKRIAVSEENFQLVKNPFFGNCYTFNMNGTLYTYQEGGVNGKATYPAGTKLNWNSNFVILLTGNLLNFNSAIYKIFKNLAMMAHITKIQKSNIANIKE